MKLVRAKNPEPLPARPTLIRRASNCWAKDNSNPERDIMSKLTNKVAVVTGASKGIGAGIAKGLAAEGFGCREFTHPARKAAIRSSPRLSLKVARP